MTLSIESKHAYRFGFLKSEWWNNFRLQALAFHKKGRCHVCGKKDFRNDVHHLRYPNQWKETKLGHVMVLCRDHHRIIHMMMDKYPEVDPAEIAQMVKKETLMFGRITQSMAASHLPLDRWMDREFMFHSIWRFKKKMLTVVESKVS